MLVLTGPAYRDQERDSGIMRFVKLAKHRGWSPRDIADALWADPYMADKFKPKGGYREAMRQARLCWNKTAYEPSETTFDPFVDASVASGGAKTEPRPRIAHNSRKPVARVLGSVADHLALDFVESAHGSFRHAPELGWLEYTEARGWVRSPSSAPPAAATLLAWSQVRAASQVVPGLSRKERRTIASASTVRGIFYLAPSDPRMAAGSPDLWDAEPFLLNTPAGIIDLRTGTSRPRTTADLFLKCCNASPSEGPTPAFDILLEGLSDGRPEVAAYIVQHFGTLLTGKADHILLFLYGTGGNGKGTLVEFMAWLMNDYAAQIPTSTLMATKHDFLDHETALARLCGARLVFADETEQGATWNEALVAQLTGGNTLSGRFRYHDAFNFTPTHKLVVVGNHRPRIEATPAMRRRYVEIDCNRTFAGADVIHDLGQRLKAEAPAVLHRLIHAGVAILRDGLNPPEAIRRDTAAVFDEHDPAAPWRRERCEFDPSYRVHIAALWADFAASLNGGANPFSRSTEFVNYLLHACPGVNRLDNLMIAGLKGKALRGIRLRDVSLTGGFPCSREPQKSSGPPGPPICGSSL